MPGRPGKVLLFVRMLFAVAREMRAEGWADKPFDASLTEFLRRVMERGQSVGIDIDEIIDLIEQLMPLILMILEVILGLFAKPPQ